MSCPILRLYPQCFQSNHLFHRESASHPVSPKGRERCDTSPHPFHFPNPANRDQREPLATTFACLFCNHENSVVVKLDKKLGLGDLSCKVCGQKFQTGINCMWNPTMRRYIQLYAAYLHPTRSFCRSRRLFRLGRRVRCRGQGKRQPIRRGYEFAVGK